MNIASYINRTVWEQPEKTAIRMDGVELTYKEFYRKACSLAKYLLENGVKKGNKLGVYMSNCPNYLIAMYATWMVGGVAVPCERIAICH